MSAAAGAGPLVPTFHGFVHNSMDGLVLFEACLSGKLHHVPRRPHDRERSSLIKSGSIFIYEENASGIKRWTDGVAWSPSRILGNFLIYRELEKPFPPGEKKRAMKRKRTSMPGEPYPRRESDDIEANEPPTPVTPPTPTVPGGEVKPEASGSDQDKELERSLIGSLVDSYGFRPDGLVKKTMSININGISHHMVSYYKVDDVKNNMLPRPLSDPRIQHISVRPELYLKQNFRAPVEESEHYAIDQQMHAHPGMWPPAGNMYNVRPGQYFASTQYPMYAVSAPPGGNVYGGMASATAWTPSQGSSGAPMYPAQPYQPQAYGNYYKPSGPSGNAPGPPKEESQSSAQSAPYSGGQYAAPPPTTASSYPGMQRNGSQSAPGAMYPNPVAPASSSYGSMSANNGRPSYSPTTNGQSQPVYGSSSGQPYAVRSPTQGYGMHNPPPSAVSQSPHTTVKSPQSAHPNTPAQSMNPDHNAQMHSQQMSYRPSSYQVPPTPQSAHPSNDINGLGISNSSSYSSQQQNAPSYGGYGSSGQAFRPVTDVSAGSQSGASYAS